MHRLIVTNGEAAVNSIRRARVPATRWLPWDDVLHEGPVGRHASAFAFRQERAKYLADRGFGSHDEILEAFVLRDEALDLALRDFDEIVLWFEHDLYDQLQLVQILDRAARAESRSAAVWLVCRDRFIAETSGEQLAVDFTARKPVDDHLLEMARRAWQAVTSPTPMQLNDLVGEDTDKLTFLPSAIVRMLQELPDAETGLSRSQRQIVELLHETPLRPGDLFQQCGKLEEARFMGDWSFWSIIGDLTSSDEALIDLSGQNPPRTSVAPDSTFFDTTLRLTAAGQDVATGRRNAIDLIGIDRWVGGTCLTAESYWTYGTGGVAGPESRATR